MICIQDIIGADGHQVITQKFGQYVTCLEYFCIQHSIPSVWKQMLKVNPMHEMYEYKTEALLQMTHPNKQIYDQLVSTKRAALSKYSKWVNKLDIDFTYKEYLSKFANIIRATQCTKYRDF